MTVGQVAVMVSLLAQIYAVSPSQLQCMVYAESSFDVAAVNGVYVGLAQWRPETMVWLDGKAQNDPLWLHRHMTMDASDPVYAVSLMAWAIRNGYGEHWSTWGRCK